MKSLHACAGWHSIGGTSGIAARMLRTAGFILLGALPAATVLAQVANLGSELFAAQTGTLLTHVPYKGAGPLAQDLVAGYIQMMMDALNSAARNVRAGKVKADANSPSGSHFSCRQIRPGQWWTSSMRI